MIYGEKEETTQSTSPTKVMTAVNNFLKITNKISTFL
jgi:hypothetical protein